VGNNQSEKKVTKKENTASYENLYHFSALDARKKNENFF